VKSSHRVVHNSFGGEGKTRVHVASNCLKGSVALRVTDKGNVADNMDSLVP
jgi:hypothetical protein